MKKTLKRFSIVCITALVTACGSTEYFVPKTLNDNAKGISTTKSTPYGCKVLGEVEGKDESSGYEIGNSLLKVREGAYNDLRNNAALVVGNTNKRTVLKITGYRATCFGRSGREICKENHKEITPIHSYLVQADVFECGDK